MVLRDLECLIIVPAKRDGILEPLETVESRAPVRAGAHGCISKRDQFVVVGAERLPCFFSCLLEDNDHEAAHEDGCIALLRIVQACVVIDLVALVLFVIHKFFEFLTE